MNTVLYSAPDELLKAWRDKFTQLSQIWHSTVVVAQRLLEILVMAAKEISVNDLDSILAAFSVKDPPAGSDISQLDTNHIIDLCSNFLALSTPKDAEGEKSQGSQLIRLIHPWLIDFFSSGQAWLSAPQANIDMAALCLEYLLTHSGSQPTGNSNRGNDFEPDRFLRYSARCWFIHAKRVDTSLDQKSLHASSSLIKRMWDLFSSEIQFAAWLEIYDPDSQEPVAGGRGSPFYYACRLGFHDLARMLITRSSLVDDADGKREYSDSDQILKQRSAVLDVAGGKHRFPLLAAIASGHPDVVQLLLENLDDANKRFWNEDTGLIRAASRDNTYIVDLLLDHGVSSPSLSSFYILTKS